MKSENINIETQLKLLSDITVTEPDSNFRDIVFKKLSYSETKSKTSFIKTSGLLLFFLAINVFSVLTFADSHSRSEREQLINKVIKSFSLDK